MKQHPSEIPPITRGNGGGLQSNRGFVIFLLFPHISVENSMIITTDEQKICLSFEFFRFLSINRIADFSNNFQHSLFNCSTIPADLQSDFRLYVSKKFWKSSGC
jgi:hypothetical protein